MCKNVEIHIKRKLFTNLGLITWYLKPYFKEKNHTFRAWKIRFLLKYEYNKACVLYVENNSIYLDLLGSAEWLHVVEESKKMQLVPAFKVNKCFSAVRSSPKTDSSVDGKSGKTLLHSENSFAAFSLNNQSNLTKLMEHKNA